MLAIFHKLETSKRMKIVRECCPLLRRKEEEVGRGGGGGEDMEGEGVIPPPGVPTILLFCV